MNSKTNLRELFFQECEDLLESLTDGFAELEHDSTDMETINAVFRAVHSIKGGAGAFGMETLVEFAHAFENLLDEVRAGENTVNPEMLSLFLQSGDHLADLVDAAQSGTEPDLVHGGELLAQLLTLSNAGGDAVPAAGGAPETSCTNEIGDVDFQPLTLDLDSPLSEGEEAGPVVMRFTALKDLYVNGNDPALLFRALEEMGDLSVEADLTALRSLAELDWDEPAITWTLTLDTTRTETEIREVFEFVEGFCLLEFLSDDPGSDTPVDPAPPHSAGPDATAPANASMAGSPTDQDSVRSDGPTRKAAGTKNTIRVDLDRVERLINIVGELVISEAMLSQSVTEMKLDSDNKVGTAMGQLKQLSSQLQESVIAIRAQPVKSLFQRMSRIVREVSQTTDKPARFATEGDYTEVDKTVIERLVDPLTHMIRNAVDHGLEDRSARAAAGKPEQGTVTLSAAHRSGRVLIRLSDDGGGINRDKVRSIAEARGLISPDAELSQSEIDNLLFLPGFSTNDEVTNLSGRGVGMDVVKNEIQALGGRVSIESEPGCGTSLTISLPLTLAVLEGMIVEVAGATVVVPTNMLRETLRAAEATIHAMGPGDRVLASHGEMIPVIDLGAFLGFRTPPQDLSEHTLLLIDSETGARIATVVDHLHEQREVVIKGLEKNYGQVVGISAATILGNGQIALIVDTDQLFEKSRAVQPSALFDKAIGA